MIIKIALKEIAKRFGSVSDYVDCTAPREGDGVGVWLCSLHNATPSLVNLESFHFLRVCYHHIVIISPSLGASATALASHEYSWTLNREIHTAQAQDL